MTDLIWIGNTLYPRWFVFSLPVAAFLFLLGAAMFFVWIGKRFGARP